MKQVLDFMVIGAQKCGTTSLHEYLYKHPSLCLPAAKEAPYFTDERKYGGNWSTYLERVLPSADPSCQWGTVTPTYMYGGAGGGGPADVRTIPLRIKKRLPEARLIAILRDPVQRARSHHAMAVIEGWETRPFDQAVDELLQPSALAKSRRELREITGYVVFGEYGRVLSGYFDVFPREQVMVLFTKELHDNPGAVVRRVFEFLAVDPEFVPDNLDTRYHESGAAPRVKWLDFYNLQMAAAANPVLRRAWHALPEQTRRRIETQYSRVNYRTRIWNRRGWSRRASSPDTERDSDIDGRLREHFEADAAVLADLVGVTPPWSSALVSGRADSSLTA
jgi:hypothetical protein